jgi:hypothetical protein
VKRSGSAARNPTTTTRLGDALGDLHRLAGASNIATTLGTSRPWTLPDHWLLKIIRLQLDYRVHDRVARHRSANLRPPSAVWRISALGGPGGAPWRSDAASGTVRPRSGRALRTRSIMDQIVHMVWRRD